MSGPNLNLSGNQLQGFNPGRQYGHLQGLNAEQLEHLNAIASMAKGSGILGTGFLEGKNGGEGFIGSFIDKVTGQKHYVKLLTQSKEREAARGKDANEARLLSNSEALGKMSNSMKDDLLELARTVGVEEKVQALLDSRSGDFKDLVDRKIAAQAVTIISEAHNKFAKLARAGDEWGINDVVRGSRKLFDWNAVERARTEGNTSLKEVLADARVVKSTGSGSVVDRQFTTSGTNIQVRLAEIEQGKDEAADRKYYVDCIKNGFVPKTLAKPLNPQLEDVSNSMVDPGVKKEARALYDKLVRDLLCELLGDSRQSLRRDDIFELACLAGNVAKEVVSKGVREYGILSAREKETITAEFKSAFLSARLADVSVRLKATQLSSANKNEGKNKAQNEYDQCCQDIRKALYGKDSKGKGEFTLNEVVALWNKLSNKGDAYVEPKSTVWKAMYNELNGEIPLSKAGGSNASDTNKAIVQRIRKFNRAFVNLEYEKKHLSEKGAMQEAEEGKLKKEKEMLEDFQAKHGIVIVLPEKVPVPIV